jgi:uncharacterized small protein (DUF1192 family)
MILGLQAGNIGTGLTSEGVELGLEVLKVVYSVGEVFDRGAVLQDDVVRARSVRRQALHVAEAMEYLFEVRANIFTQALERSLVAENPHCELEEVRFHMFLVFIGLFFAGRERKPSLSIDLSLGWGRLSVVHDGVVP